MQRLIAFSQVSLDGYFCGVNGDISWAHKDKQDAEWNAFVSANATGDGLLLFGRRTYELMASYWPTPFAAQNDPVLAERMNHRPKVVFSRTLNQVSWSNTALAKDDLAPEIRRLKAGPGPGMAILGSGSIVSQLAQAGLIDEFQIVVNSIVLGAGKTLFDGIQDKLQLKLTKTRAFANGSVFLTYEPTG